MIDFDTAINSLIFHQTDDRPFFIYSAEKLKSNVDDAKSMLRKLNLVTSGSQFYYSVKANPNKTLIDEILKNCNGLDVSSERELEYVLQQGLLGDQITVSGPAKTDRFLKRAVQAGVKVIHIDNKEEYELLAELPATKSTYSLRINIDDKSSKLGLKPEDAEKILNTNSLNIIGFHFYLGRESFSELKIMDALNQILPLADRFYAKKSLDLFIGPAFPSGLDVNHLSIISHPLLERPEIQIHFEMGRVIAETSARYCAKVLAVKENRNGKKEIIINGGIQHLSSTLISIKRKEAVHVSRVGKNAQQKCEANIYGSLCLSNDLIFITDECPPDIKRGDWLQFFPCGAYNLSASAVDFIMQDQAREYIIRSNNIEEISR